MHSKKTSIAVLIPVYQPSPDLIQLLVQIQALDNTLEIIVINDGSDTEYDLTIFAEIKKLSRVKIVKHQNNLGKGEALKTGFRIYLERFSTLSVGVVTADADGQHQAKDIIALCEAIKCQPNQLHLGVRSFQTNVPWRSKIGNRLTATVLATLYNIRLRDTQTGLRAIPRRFMENLLQSKRSGYEFELEMLIRADKMGLKIKETSIATIYENNNQSSHFNPVFDSMKIYFVFIRFSSSSILSSALDFMIFCGFFYWKKTVFLAMCLSRSISGIFNYQLNKHWAFKNTENNMTAIRYTVLLTTLGGASYLLIHFFQHLNINTYLSKVIAESILFVISFGLQRFVIFKKS